MLNSNGTDGTVLDENDDAERYLIRKVSQSEARSLVHSRRKPVFPPIAVMAHENGVVVVEALVGKSGDVEKVNVISGPRMEQAAAADAARGWSFRPMMVGSRAVPYELQLVFNFRTTGPSYATVDMKP